LPPDVIFQSQNASKSISAGAPPQNPLRELTALFQIPWLNLRSPTSKGGEGKGREKRGRKGREGTEMWAPTFFDEVYAYAY